MEKIMLVASLFLLLELNACSKTENNSEVKNTKSEKIQTDTKMNNENSQDKLDVEKFKKTAKKWKDLDSSVGYRYEFYKKYPKGRTVRILGSDAGSFAKYEYNVPKPYYLTIFIYYPDGSLEEKRMLDLGSSTEIGVWVYYDKTGKKIKEINKEDIPVRKFSYQDLLDLMHKEGVINLNDPESDPFEGCNPMECPNRLDVYYGRKENIWYFNKMRNYEGTSYAIDAKDGSIISKKQFQGFDL